MFTSGEDVALQDACVSRMVSLMETAREKSKHIEMELRLGRFNSENHFQPGYGSRELANKLVDAMMMNCKHKPNWQKLEPVQFFTAQYPGNVRKRVMAGKQETIRKTRIGNVDIGSNREFGLRFAVNEELPIVSDRVDIDPPLSLWITERVSFIETIQLTPQFSFRIRYDISKQSQKEQNKLQLESKKADFHCEIELMDELTCDSNYLKLIAMELLNIGKSCMGTHYMTSSGKMKLTPPNLFLIK